MVFRRRNRWVAVTLLGLLALVGLSGVLAATTTLGHVSGALMAAAAIYLAICQARVAVILTDTEVIVRNAFRTHRLPFADIVAVQKPSLFGYGMARKPGVVFTLRDGREVSADAYVKAAWDREIGGELVSAVQSRIATNAQAVSD
jgi:hypothetical protein